jgi:transglutaminase-like putative cysteine protease
MGAVGVSSGIALVDRHGVVGPVAAEPAYRIQYRRSGERPYPVAEPDAGDLEVPEVVWRLKRVAHEWTKDAQTPEEIASAIMDRLQGDDFRYSLHFRYRSRRDPIVEFILDEREGHCEFFASAMAILLRLRGVPARLVGGYRVTEKNPIGDYYIVRERNAHAWVEAYLPGKGWTTFDPTPAAELAPDATTTSFVAGLIDAAGSGWAAFLDWLDQRTWTEVLSVPAVVIVIPLLIRILLQRRARSRREEEDLYAQSLPCFDQLTEALEQHGIIRGASETIEQLASRLDEADGELARDGPDLLRRYAAHRYGKKGDRKRLEADILAFCEQLETRTRDARA